jgi:phosphoglycolate phosphatase-like HAD superfamily hydrolase
MLIGLDLDGTLLDSRLRHVVALYHAAEVSEVPLCDEDAQAYFKLKCDGYSGIEAMRQLGIAQAEDISRRWVEMIESEEMLALDRLYPDTLDMLKRRREHGNVFVLVTGRHNSKLACRQIAKLGLEEYFHDIIIVDPLDRFMSKALAARRHDFNAIVGDTEIDLQWAEDLGVDFYASSFGFRSESYWIKRRVTSYVSLSDIFDAISQIENA